MSPALPWFPKKVLVSDPLHEGLGHVLGESRPDLEIRERGVPDDRGRRRVGRGLRRVPSSEAGQLARAPLGPLHRRRSGCLGVPAPVSRPTRS